MLSFTDSLPSKEAKTRCGRGTPAANGRPYGLIRNTGRLSRPAKTLGNILIKLCLVVDGVVQIGIQELGNGALGVAQVPPFRR